MNLTPSAFARELNKSPGNMSNILAGRIVNGVKTKPPLEEMDRWAVALRLDDVRTATLKKLAALEHCPDEIRLLVAGYEMSARDPVDTNRALLAEQVDELQARLKILDAENQEMRARLKVVSEAATSTPTRRAASDSEPYAAEQRELDMVTNPDAYARPPAPTYPRPAPIRGGSDG